MPADEFYFETRQFNFDSSESSQKNSDISHSNWPVLLCQSLLTNTLVEHAYTEMHKLKNKQGGKKNLQ